jgi:hypothetical protein
MIGLSDKHTEQPPALEAVWQLFNSVSISLQRLDNNLPIHQPGLNLRMLDEFMKHYEQMGKTIAASHAQLSNRINHLETLVNELINLVNTQLRKAAESL